MGARNSTVTFSTLYRVTREARFNTFGSRFLMVHEHQRSGHAFYVRYLGRAVVNQGNEESMSV
jgi:hypothetical protein